MTVGDPELAAVLATVTLRPTRRVAAAVVDVAEGARTRTALIGADVGTPFEIGSITKGLTGLLLADAVDRGELSLETTVGEVLPEIADSRLGGVTVRRLCTHTAGLPRVPMTPLFLLRATLGLGLLGRDPYRGWTPSAVIRAAARQQLRAPDSIKEDPGQYSYSNLGGALLGQLIAAAALTTDGAGDYPTLLRDRILTPIGMGATHVATPTTTAAPGRSARGLPRMPWVLDGFAPAGGVVSTLADAGLLAAALLTGTTTGGQPTPGFSALDPIEHVATGAAGRETGMFWVLDRSPATGHRRIWHNGATGGYSAFLGLYPDLGRGVVVLCSNARGADTERVAAAIARTFLG